MLFQNPTVKISFQNNFDIQLKSQSNNPKPVIIINQSPKCTAIDRVQITLEVH